jgi:anti-anti-sigma regulatory factor
MLRIDTEFRKGIFFIRLNGRIDNYENLDRVNELIEDVGIKYVVLNTSNLHMLDVNTINYIINYNNKILKSKRYLLLCDTNYNRKRIFNNIPNINYEIEAFTLI